jgi:hypothetical protein
MAVVRSGSWRRHEVFLSNSASLPASLAIFAFLSITFTQVALVGRVQILDIEERASFLFILSFLFPSVGRRAGLDF